MDLTKWEVTKNRSTRTEILNHFIDTDEKFLSKLLPEKSLHVYISKLYQLSDRIEVWYHDVLLGLLAHYCDTLNSRCYITNLSVKKGFTRKGIARVMFEQLLSECRSEEIHIIELEVYAYNEEAIYFYRAYGFSVKESEGELLKMTLSL